VGSRGPSSCETFLVYWPIGKVQKGPDQAGSGYSLQHKIPQSDVIVLADFNLFQLYLSQHVEYGNFGIQNDTASDGVNEMACHGVDVPNRRV
jgi:hypothetical protein